MSSGYNKERQICDSAHSHICVRACVCVCSSVMVVGMHVNKSILVMIMIIVTQVQHKIHVCMYNQPASIVMCAYLWLAVIPVKDLKVPLSHPLI